MATSDPRIDAYIAAARPFARPILEHLRALVRRGCPAVVETMKWRMPFFEHHGVLCHLAAFTAHCSFGFWRSKQVLAASDDRGAEAMGQFGRIAALADLPADAAIVGWVRAAAALNESRPRQARTPKAARKRPLPIPAAFAAALDRHPRSRAGFAGLTPGCRREYVQWIAEAKRDATRDQRIATAIGWLAEGKRRNWKYEAR